MKDSAFLLMKDSAFLLRLATIQIIQGSTTHPTFYILLFFLMLDKRLERTK